MWTHVLRAVVRARLAGAVLAFAAVLLPVDGLAARPELEGTTFELSGKEKLQVTGYGRDKEHTSVTFSFPYEGSYECVGGRTAGTSGSVGGWVNRTTMGLSGTTPYRAIEAWADELAANRGKALNLDIDFVASMQKAVVNRRGTRLRFKARYRFKGTDLASGRTVRGKVTVSLKGKRR
jgi:hypothetical protein